MNAIATAARHTKYTDKNIAVFVSIPCPCGVNAKNIFIYLKLEHKYKKYILYFIYSLYEIFKKI